ncbi:MAG: hypothetical protein JW969_12765 [Spirochaetales bacterium]|nr:hypothetical protein [Spirochaetales bacterium]
MQKIIYVLIAAAALVFSCSNFDDHGTYTCGHAELFTSEGPQPYVANCLVGQRVTVEITIMLTNLCINAVDPGPKVIMYLWSCDDYGDPKDEIMTTPIALLAEGEKDVDIMYSLPVYPGTYWLFATFGSDATLANDNATNCKTITSPLKFGMRIPFLFPEHITFNGPHIALYLKGTY